MHALLRKFRSQTSNTPHISTSVSDPTLPKPYEAGPLPANTPPASLPLHDPLAVETPISRKIHPNLDELAQQPDPRASTSAIGRKTDEFGQLPPALARIANRKVDEHAEASGDDAERSLEAQSSIPTTPPPTTRALSKLSLPLFSSPTSGWSTFGRRDRGNVPIFSSSRGSSQSRHPTTTTHTPPKSVAASRSNSTRKPGTSSPNNTSSNMHSSSPTTHESPQTFGTPSIDQRTSFPSSPAVQPLSFSPLGTHERDISNPSDAQHEYQTTYPPRTRKSSSNLNYSSLQFTFGRSRINRTHADEVFPSESPLQHPQSDQDIENGDESGTNLGLQHQPAIGQAAENLVRLSLIETSPETPLLPSPDPQVPDGSEPHSLDWNPDIPVSTLVQFDPNGSDTSEQKARLEQAVKIRERTEERKRRRTISTSSSLRRGALRRMIKDKSFPHAFPTTSNRSDTSSGPSTPIIGILPLTSTSNAPVVVVTQPLTDGTNSQGGGVTTTGGEDPKQLLPTLSVTAPTPMASPSAPTKIPATPGPSTLGKNLRVPETHTRKVSLVVHGKRKAVGSDDEDEGGDQRSRRTSDAPSSYPRKRMRVHSPEPSSRPHSPGLQRGPSSLRSGSSAGHGRSYTNRHSRNASQVSIPISAIIAPRAPSLHRATSNSTTRGHDPLKNKYREMTWEETWQLDRSDMPPHAWLFLAGFLIPIAWWIGTIYPLPIFGHEPPAGDQPKNKWFWGHRRQSTSGTVVGADEWVHHALLIRARAWRLRCIIASLVSIFVYVPVIVVAVIYSRR